MKITVNREQLLTAVSNVQRAVSTKASMPALEGILLRAQGDRISLSGYNLELGITTDIEADVYEPGEIVLGAKLFCDIVRRLPEECVLMEVDERFMTLIRCGASEFSVVGMPAEEYPELPEVTGGTELDISGEVLKNMIDQTIYAVSQNEAKPVHTGTLFELGEGKLRLVSLDGFRMAVRTEDIGTQESMRFVVPGKTLSEISKLIVFAGANANKAEDEPETSVSVTVGRRHIIFEVGGYRFISRLIEGEFIDYNAVIPHAVSTGVTVNTRRFIDAIERISLLITDRIKSPLRCIFDEDMIKASCATTAGKANDEFECLVSGERVEMGFNNRYLIEALRASGCDEVKIELNGPLAPMKVLPPQGDEFLFLVLPVRLKNE